MLFGDIVFLVKSFQAGIYTGSIIEQDIQTVPCDTYQDSN